LALGKYRSKLADINYWLLYKIMPNLTPENTANWQYLLASFLISIGIIYRYGKQPNNLAVYGVAWTSEIFTAEALAIFGNSSLKQATANIILGLLSLLITNWILFKRSSLSELISLDLVPLIYAALGIIWRLNSFTAHTGLITLGTAIIGIGIGDRKSWKALSYLSVAAISVAGYEIVIYQMLQQSGVRQADGLTILGLVAATIAVIYRILVWFWQKKRQNNIFNLTVKDILSIAHIHWAIGSFLTILALVISIDSKPQLGHITILVSLILVGYALERGKNNNPRSDWWIYTAAIHIIIASISARSIWSQLSILDPYKAIIVCLVAVIIEGLPWQNWGWRSTPWYLVAVTLPTLTALLSVHNISYVNLLVIAAFYVWIAIARKNIRWTYMSLWFIDWGLTKFLVEYNFTDILWYASIIGLSLLAIAEFDPVLITAPQRKNRHYLRIFGSGIICLTALLFHQKTGITPSIISLLFILTGLGLRIRAFLFVGTINFMLTVFYQLIILVFDRSFLKWVIGLVAGIILISIAANFERRREQIISLFQNWFEQLREWY
jgi:hypothetical protein